MSSDVSCRECAFYVFGFVSCWCDHHAWDKEHYGILGRPIGLRDETPRPDWCPLEVCDDFRSYATATQSIGLREEVSRSLEHSLIEYASVWDDLARV